MNLIRLLDYANDLRYGNKAFNLNLLIRAGLNVPFGIAISSDFAKKHIDSCIENFNSYDERLEYIRENIPLLNLSDYFDSDNLIIRSSSLNEDSISAMGSGVYDSIKTNEKSLFEALTICIASSYTDGAIEYRKRHGIQYIDHIGMIVQKYQSADISGIVFSGNQITGNRDEMLIELKEGGCDQLTDGACIPISFCLDRASGNISYLSSERIDEPYLDLIVKTVTIAEKALDTYVDMEFLIKNEKIFALQARPLIFYD